MSSDSPSPSQVNSQEFLAEARRQAAMAEHGELISEMESSIGDNLVSGSADNPRLQRVIQALDNDEARQRLNDALKAMASYPAFNEMPLQEALIEHSCILRSHAGTEVAKLQIHIIGVYRRIRELMYHQQSLVPDLHDLRTLATGRLERLLNPLPLSFGSPSSEDALVITDTQFNRIIERSHNFIHPDGADDSWCDDGRDIIITREMEKPIIHLKGAERSDARESIRSKLIRERFYNSVFSGYLGRDELGDDELDAHFTLLHWMQQMAETPHLYPFMQGQTATQKRYRLSELSRKLLQLHELYQRIDRASNSAEYADSDFAELTTGKQLLRLHRDNFPPLDIDDNFIATAFLCPFATFARWVQKQVAADRFLLPGD